MKKKKGEPGKINLPYSVKIDEIHGMLENLVKRVIPDLDSRIAANFTEIMVAQRLGILNLQKQGIFKTRIGMLNEMMEEAVKQDQKMKAEQDTIRKSAMNRMNTSKEKAEMLDKTREELKAKGLWKEAE